MKLFISIFVSFVFCWNIFAWGAGHHSTAKKTMQYLPEECKKMLSTEDIQEIIKSYCHNPDSVVPIEGLGWSRDEIKQYRNNLKQMRKKQKITDKTGKSHDENILLPSKGALSKDELELYLSFGIANTQKLHNPPALPLTWLLLSRAYNEAELAKTEEEKKIASKKIATHIGTLSHIYADEVAVNHDPLVVVYTYGFVGFAAESPNSLSWGDIKRWVELSTPAAQAEADDIAQKLYAGFKPSIIGNNMDEIIDAFARHRRTCSDYMAEITPELCRSLSFYDDPEERLKYIKTMLLLDKKSVQHCIDAIYTAWVYRKESKDLKIPANVLDRMKRFFAADAHERSLEKVGYFKPLIEKADPKAKIGIVVEPNYGLMETAIGYGAKYQSLCFMNEMVKKNVPFRMLDTRRIYEDGFPEPTQMPVVILNLQVSRNLYGMDMGKFKTRIDDYMNKGGNILFCIGNVYKKLPGNIQLVPDQISKFIMCSNGYSSAFNPSDYEDLRNAGKYDRLLNDCKLTYLNQLGKVAGNDVKTFIGKPLSAAGQHKPNCNMFFAESENIQALVSLTFRDKTRVTGALIELDKKGHKIIVLPMYALYPHIMASSKVENLAEPPLDNLTRKVFFKCLEILSGKNI